MGSTQINYRLMQNKLTLLLTTILLLSIGVYAQSPEAINYQAVARNLSGVPLVNQGINVRYEIRLGSAAGSAVYIEDHALTTNQFGLFTAEIGNGTPFSGSFSGINWGSGSYYLYVEVNGDPMGATQLLSVPYALYSKESANGPTGAPGKNSLALSTPYSGAMCPNGGTQVDVGLDDNGDGTLQALEIDFTYYVCDGVDGTNGTNGVNGTNGTDGVGIVSTVDNGNGTFTINYSDATSFTTSDLTGPAGTNGTTYYPGNGITLSNDTIINTGDNDNDANNELISTTGLNGSTIEITEAGTLHTIDLSGIINSNDTSATNEIQTLSINTTSDTIFLSNGGGYVALPSTSADTDWTQGAGVIYNTSELVGIGTNTPTEQLTVFSTDTVVGSFTGSNSDAAIVSIAATNPSAKVGTVYLTGSDTGIIAIDPTTKQFFITNTVAGGHTIIEADSVVSINGQQVALIAQDIIYNQSPSIYNETDTIYSYSPSGTIIQVNQGQFLTDSLYVLGNNAASLNWVLTNDGTGQAIWTDPTTMGLGGSLWQSNTPDIYFNTGNVGIGTTSPAAKLDVVGDATTPLAIRGTTTQPSSYGVRGENLSTTGNASGVYGMTQSTNGYGVSGIHSSATGPGAGIYGTSTSTTGIALSGVSQATTGVNYGALINNKSPDGTAVEAWNQATSGNAYGVKASTSSPTGYAGYFAGGRNYFQGNVGIGTNNPTSRLTIDNANATDLEFVGGANSDINAPGQLNIEAGTVTYINSGFQTHFWNSGNTRMSIMADGKVGIGTTTPSQLLTVSSLTSTTIRMERANAAAFDWEINVDNLGFHLKGGADSTGPGLTDFVNVDGFGKMGLGITTPTQLLHVYNGTIRIDDGVNPYNLPSSDGTVSGQVLTTDAAGNTSWSTPPSITSLWNQLGDSLFPSTLTNNIGIGTPSPKSDLQIGNYMHFFPLDFVGPENYSVSTYNAYWDGATVRNTTGGTSGISILGHENGAPVFAVQLFPSQATGGDVMSVSPVLRMNLKQKGLGINKDNPAAGVHIVPIESAALLMEHPADGSNSTLLYQAGDGNLLGLQVPNALPSGSYTLVYPPTLPATNGAPMVSDINGNLSWGTPLAASPWTDGGTDIYPTTLADRVAIGVISATNSKFQVDNSTEQYTGNFRQTTAATAFTQTIRATNNASGSFDKTAVYGAAFGTGADLVVGVNGSANGGTNNRGIEGLASGNVGQRTAVFGTVTGAGTGPTQGLAIYNSASNTGTSFAATFSNTNSTSSNTYGVRSTINSTTTGINNQYGFYSTNTSNSGSAYKYGYYAGVGGPGITNYGIYTEVNGAGTNWAAFFADGNVYVGDTLIIPTNATPGAVLTSIDASGTAVWQMPSPSNIWSQTGTEIHYNSGNVGVGMANPNYLFHIQDSTASAGSELLRIENNIGSNILKVDNDGLVQISSGGKLEVISSQPTSILGTNGSMNGTAATFSNTSASSTAPTLIVKNANTNSSAAVFSSGNVGIGMTAPNYLFHIQDSTASAGTVLQQTEDMTGIPVFTVTNDRYVGISNGNPSANLDVFGTFKYNYSAAIDPGAVLTSTDAAGNAVWKPKNVAFEVRGTNVQNVDNVPTLLQFDAISLDDGGNFDPSAGNYMFVVPVNGVYSLQSSVTFDYSSAGPNDITVVQLLVNNTPVYESNVPIVSGERTTSTISTTTRLSPGDAVQIRIHVLFGGSTITTATTESVWFSGHLVYAY